MKIVKKVLFILVTIILSLVLAFNIYNFISLKVLNKDIATINGYAVLEVATGSMEPTIHVGDLIIINTKEKNYKEQDIITFYDTNGSFVTHRIISLDKDKMVTKGDNNNTEDEELSTKNIVGKYVGKISGVGIILSSLKSPLVLVMIFIIGILICYLVSTDKHGKPILDEEEKLLEEFRNQKKTKTNSTKTVTNKNVNVEDKKATTKPLKSTKVNKTVKTEDKNKKTVAKKTSTKPLKETKLSSTKTKENIKVEDKNKKSTSKTKSENKKGTTKKKTSNKKVSDTKNGK